jgi:hypothetical protein
MYLASICDDKMDKKLSSRTMWYNLKLFLQPGLLTCSFGTLIFTCLSICVILLNFKSHSNDLIFKLIILTLKQVVHKMSKREWRTYQCKGPSLIVRSFMVWHLSNSKSGNNVEGVKNGPMHNGGFAAQLSCHSDWQQICDQWYIYMSNVLITQYFHINGSSKWLHCSASKSNRPDIALWWLQVIDDSMDFLTN